jgi:hypothetical protein
MASIAIFVKGQIPILVTSRQVGWAASCRRQRIGEGLVGASPPGKRLMWIVKGNWKFDIYIIWYIHNTEKMILYKISNKHIVFRWFKHKFMYATHCLIFVYKQPNTVLNFMFCLWVILKFSLDQACYVHTKVELWTRVPIGYIYILYIYNKCQGKLFTRLSDWLVYIGIVNVGFMNTAISEDSQAQWLGSHPPQSGYGTGFNRSTRRKNTLIGRNPEPCRG